MSRANGRKAIFITGAASGMGLETARLFASNGWYVGGVDVNTDGLRALEQEPDLSIEELASRACLSLYHFHRVFTAVAGEAPGEMCRRLRMQRAAWQLCYTDASITAIALEPGEYELYTWGLHVNAFGGYGYIGPKSPPPPLPFTVKAGEVTYLGALHGETVMGRNIIGLPLAASGYPVIEDNRSRDEPMFRGRFPMLANWPITSANLNGQLWVQGDVDRQFTPTPMPTPVTK